MRKILYRIIDLLPLNDVLYVVYKYLLLDQHNKLPIGKEQAQELYERMITLSDLTDIDIHIIEKIGRKYSMFNIPIDIDIYPLSSSMKIQQIQTSLERNRLSLPNIPIIITMTSCKRFDLFQRTVNSMINCVTDLCHYVTEWIVVDDNSSEGDRLKMKAMYPFITLIEKDIYNKGHAQSMNIIIDELKNRDYCKFVFHLEDDWLFVKKHDWFTDCLLVLNTNIKFGQCLINHRYAEDFETGYNIGGGFIKTILNENKIGNITDLNFYIHEYYAGSCLEEQIKIITNTGFMHNMYWPHYSLRPGLMRTEVFSKLGKYNQDASHFEREYAYRYVAAGYLTTYLIGVNSIHIGRKTYERNDTSKQNAYTLNNQQQFGELNENKINEAEIFLDDISASVARLNTSIDASTQIIDYTNPEQIERVLQNKRILKSYLLNLKRRPDRWNTFIRHSIEKDFQLFHRFNAIDGSELRPNLLIQKLFSSGDFNYRQGIVGCAMSHLEMWHELSVSNLNDMQIIEDDAILANNFTAKVIHVLDQAPPDYDIIFLGHHLYPQYKTEESYQNDEYPKIEEWYSDRCIKESMGGTTGYIISKKGAQKMIRHIREHGIYNAIDWVMFKNARLNSDDTTDRVKIFYTMPHLVYAPCVQGNVDVVDSDIQHAYQSVKYDDWFSVAKEYFNKIKSLNYIHDDRVPSNRELLDNITVFTNYQNQLPKNLHSIIPVYFYQIDSILIVIGEKLITDDIKREIPFNGYLPY